jgi:DNA-binding response OmpR family regulator
LLIEDEPLVGMMMADLLSDLKFTVLGPFASGQEGTVAIDQGRLRLALLDVNRSFEGI